MTCRKIDADLDQLRLGGLSLLADNRQTNAQAHQPPDSGNPAATLYGDWRPRAIEAPPCWLLVPPHRPATSLGLSSTRWRVDYFAMSVSLLILQKRRVICITIPEQGISLPSIDHHRP